MSTELKTPITYENILKTAKLIYSHVEMDQLKADDHLFGILTNRVEAVCATSKPHTAPVVRLIDKDSSFSEHLTNAFDVVIIPKSTIDTKDLKGSSGSEFHTHSALLNAAKALADRDVVSLSHHKRPMEYMPDYLSKFVLSDNCKTNGQRTAAFRWLYMLCSSRYETQHAGDMAINRDPFALIDWSNYVKLALQKFDGDSLPDSWSMKNKARKAGGDDGNIHQEMVVPKKMPANASEVFNWEFQVRKCSSSSRESNENYVLDTRGLVDLLASFNDARTIPRVQIMSTNTCGKGSCFAENTWFTLHHLNTSNTDPNKNTAYVIDPQTSKEVQLWLRNFRYEPEMFEDDDIQIYEDDA